MAKKFPLLFAAAAAVVFYAAPSWGQDEIIVNGLPCNVFCQVYMGVGPRAKEHVRNWPPLGISGQSQYERDKPRLHRHPPAPRQENSADDENDDSPPPPVRRRLQRKAAGAPPPACGRTGTCKSPAQGKPIAASKAPADVPAAAPSVTAPPQTPPPATMAKPPQVPAPVASSAPPPADAAGSGFNVLIVLADSATSKLSDLNQKTVVIAGPATLSQDAVARAFATAGVVSAKINQGSKADLDSLVKGLVSAAVVACLPPAKAQTFPIIAGFAVFKVLVAKSDASCS